MHPKAANGLSHPHGRTTEFEHDLAVAQRPADAMGMGSSLVPGSCLSAYEVKALHRTLADLTDDELKEIPILPIGTRLEAGAKYLDLAHLEQRELVGEGGNAC